MTSPTPQEARLTRRKYRNVPTVVDGIRFASKAEAKRYGELKLLAKAGAITGLELQHRYPLHDVSGAIAAHYVADFDYFDTKRGQHITEDVKGVLTRAFKLKAKFFEAQYGRPITLIQRPSP